MKLDLFRRMSQWELKRENRYAIEDRYKNFTGHIDFLECHIPYTNFRNVEAMMDRAEKIKGKKMLVIAADFLNLDLFGPFLSTTDNVSMPEDEIKMGLELLKEAAKVYDYEVFLEGNHDARISKVVKREVKDVRVQDQINKLVGGYDKIFKEAKKLDIVHSYIFQIGNVLIAHMENNSSVPGKTGRDLVQYLVPRIKKHWDVIYQAHTHSQSKLPIDRKLAIEIGCAADSLDYWIRGKMSGKGKFGTMGYGVCDMVRGYADMNDCNFVISQWQGYI